MGNRLIPLHGALWNLTGTSLWNANVRIGCAGTVSKPLFNYLALLHTCSVTPMQTTPRFFQLPNPLYRHLLEGTRHNVLTIFAAWFIDSTRREPRRNRAWRGGGREIQVYVLHSTMLKVEL